MFGMGMNEILIALAIAVIVIGPKQLPQMARAMGKMMAQFKRATNDLRNAVSEEVDQHSQFGELREMKETVEAELRNIEYDSKSMIEEQFEEERKIGGGVAKDLAAAVNEFPARDFEYDGQDESDSAGEQKPAEAGQEAKTTDAEPPKAEGGGGAEAAEAEDSTAGGKTSDGGYA